ncbi:hypothetical protein [Streptomyces corynorhini]|nr:hypothetical protein [Streptomyces corynorhini]
MGAAWGVFAGLGVIVAQCLLPRAAATASAAFHQLDAIAGALGGLTGSLGTGWSGLPHVFLAPTLYCLAATVGMAVMSRTRHDVGRPPPRRVLHRPSSRAVGGRLLVRAARPGGLIFSGHLRVFPGFAEPGTGGWCGSRDRCPAPGMAWAPSANTASSPLSRLV